MDNVVITTNETYSGTGTTISFPAESECAVDGEVRASLAHLKRESIEARTIRVDRIQFQLECLLGEMYHILDIAVANKQQHTAMKSEISVRFNSANSKLRQLVFEPGEDEEGYRLTARPFGK